MILYKADKLLQEISCLEGQFKGPSVNPVEGGLAKQAILVDMARKNPGYVMAFKVALAAGKH